LGPKKQKAKKNKHNPSIFFSFWKQHITLKPSTRSAKSKRLQGANTPKHRRQRQEKQGANTPKRRRQRLKR